jgi:hypothetical protein
VDDSAVTRLLEELLALSSGPSPSTGDKRSRAAARIGDDTRAAVSEITRWHDACCVQLPHSHAAAAARDVGVSSALPRGEAQPVAGVVTGPGVRRARVGDAPPLASAAAATAPAVSAGTTTDAGASAGAGGAETGVATVVAVVAAVVAATGAALVEAGDRGWENVTPRGLVVVLPRGLLLLARGGGADRSPVLLATVNCGMGRGEWLRVWRGGGGEVMWDRGGQQAVDGGRAWHATCVGVILLQKNSLYGSRFTAKKNTGEGGGDTLSGRVGSTDGSRSTTSVLFGILRTPKKWLSPPRLCSDGVTGSDSRGGWPCTAQDKGTTALYSIDTSMPQHRTASGQACSVPVHPLPAPSLRKSVSTVDTPRTPTSTRLRLNTKPHPIALSALTRPPPRPPPPHAPRPQQDHASTPIPPPLALQHLRSLHHALHHLSGALLCRLHPNMDLHLHVPRALA